MKTVELLQTKNNISYPNINTLRKYIQIINDYNDNNYKSFFFKKEHLDFCFSNDYDYNRSYNSNMTFLELYYYDSGDIIFKLNLNDLTFDSYFNDKDEMLISDFINSDFIIDFNVFKKRRIRQIKIKKLI